MTTTYSNETNISEDYGSSRDERRQRYPSTNSSTPTSSGGDKQFHLTNYSNERSGQNSRTSSLAEANAPVVNNEGFSNFGEIVQHLQTVWFDHHIHDGSRRTAQNSTVTSSNNPHVNETVVSHHSKGSSQNHSSQSHYSHHQSGQQQYNNQYSGQAYWNNYNNPRRPGAGNYNRNHSGGTNDFYWNPKSNRFPSHRSMNNLMNNPGNYQQQSQASPPTQRRQGDQQYYHNDQQQSSQSYYKKNRSDHDRRPNGYNNYQQQQQQQQQSSDYSSNTNTTSNVTSETTTISSTQSYPSHLNSYNR